MNAKTVAIAFVCLLCVVACVIPYIALTDEYERAVAGETLPAKVVKVSKKRNGDPYIKVEYVQDDEVLTRVSKFASEEDRNLKVGASVQVIHTENSVTLAHSAESGRPSILLLFGAAFFLLATVYTLVLPTLRARRRAARTSPLDIVTDSLRRTRKMAFIVGGGIFAFGGFMIWLAASGADETASDAVNIAIGVFGTFTAGVGLLVTRPGFQLIPIERSEVYGTIIDRPHDIAWMYERVVATEGAEAISSLHDVWLWFSNGKAFSIQVEVEDAKALLEELQKRAPHAAVGYSAEVERQYKADPSRFSPM